MSKNEISPLEKPVSKQEAYDLLRKEWKKEVTKADGTRNDRLCVAYVIAMKELRK